MKEARYLSRCPVLCSAAAILILAGQAAAQDSTQAKKGDRLVLLDEHGLTLQSPDGGVVFHLGGRLHVDAGSGDSSAVTD